MTRSRSALFFTVYLLYFLSFWMVLAYLPLVLKAYHFSDGQIGFAIGLNSLASLILVLPFGVFSDYFSAKRTLVLATAFYATYFVMLIMFQDFVRICLAMILGGVGAATIRVVLMSLYLKLIEPSGRGKKVAFLQLGGYLGFAVGPLIGGQVYAALGAPAMIKVALGLSAGIFVSTLFLKDAPPVVFTFKDYNRDIRNPDALFLMAVVFVLGTHFGAEQTSISLFMQHNVGLSKQEIGMVFFGLGTWMALLVPFAGVVADRRRQVFGLLLIGLLISSCFQVITVFAYSFWSLLAIRMAHTAGDTLCILEADVLTARFFPSSRLGGNSGLVFFVRTLAIFVFAAVSGWLNQHWGYKMPFIVNGSMVFALASIAFIYRATSRAGSRP
ncbi:MAG: MFS transporter [Deltaproteobacteria bacterium]|nr:MFS transporter [Deltaproteobacteria bacterium]